MSRIRKIEIENYRSIRTLTWLPSSGINCIIGPGDSGKSTVLDAIDLCLGARRAVQLSDADFHNLDVAAPIVIRLTIGELDDALKNIETYGLYLRGFNSVNGNIEDEPDKGLETVITLQLSVESDLEPVWTLVSDRSKSQSLTRNLTWGDRVRLAPTRIGALSDFNLGWRRGSVLNRLTDEKADSSAALAKAARDARGAFGDDVEKQLEGTLRIVGETAKELGINVGDKVRALLDAHSVTFSGGAISLHDEDGIPLRGLGIGSTRLLVAGLQRKAAIQSSILLVDELESGMEPHRIIRFLNSLGAKESVAPLQCFMTTHSPVALCELSGKQLFVLREVKEIHSATCVGAEDDVQSTVRLYPHAFLATSILVCEGASEVGLIRGLDQYLTSAGSISITARGVSLVDCGGGDGDRPYKRASAFRRLGYRVGILRDDDKKPSAGVEEAFLSEGGKVFKWRDGRALEDELFLSLSAPAIGKLLEFAVELHTERLIDEHLKSFTNGSLDIQKVRAEVTQGSITPETRAALGKASRGRKAGWFKTVTWMEELAREKIASELQHSDTDAEFIRKINDVFAWTQNA